MGLSPALFQPAATAATDGPQTSADTASATAERELILRCPESGGRLLYFEAEGFLLCPTSRLRYPITEDGIPVMLVDDADRLSEAEVEALLSQRGAHSGQ